jgi:hypothetical protein
MTKEPVETATQGKVILKNLLLCDHEPSLKAAHTVGIAPVQTAGKYLTNYPP